MKTEITLMDIDRYFTNEKNNTSKFLCLWTCNKGLPRYISGETVAAWAFFSNIRALEEKASFAKNGDFVTSASVQDHKTKVRTEKTPRHLWKESWRWIDTSLLPFLYPENCSFTPFWKKLLWKHILHLLRHEWIYEQRRKVTPVSSF